MADAFIELHRLHEAFSHRTAFTAEGGWAANALLVKLAARGPQRASDLAALVRADPSTISRHVAGLVKAGLLERQSDPDDGRASILAVTEAGRSVAADHVCRRGELVDAVVADWSPADREQFLELLRRYIGNLRERTDEIHALVQRTVIRESVPSR